MIYIGIDPGVSGGIAAIDEGGHIVQVSKMPETDADIFDQLFNLMAAAAADRESVVAALEHVWSTPGQGGAFKFGVSVGGLRMALTGCRIPFDLVLPRKWQKALSIAYPKGATDTEKKNRTKSRAQQLFPGQIITHALADALLIAEYRRRMKEF